MNMCGYMHVYIHKFCLAFCFSFRCSGWSKNNTPSLYGWTVYLHVEIYIKKEWVGFDIYIVLDYKIKKYKITNT